jgi:hypothetical protein
MANSMPTAAWSFTELLSGDPGFYQALHAEVLTAIIKDAVNSKSTIDIRKLLSLPPLILVYAETMRLHVSYTKRNIEKLFYIFERYSIRENQMKYS